MSTQDGLNFLAKSQRDRQQRANQANGATLGTTGLPNTSPSGLPKPSANPMANSTGQALQQSSPLPKLSTSSAPVNPVQPASPATQAPQLANSQPQTNLAPQSPVQDQQKFTGQPNTQTIPESAEKIAQLQGTNMPASTQPHDLDANAIAADPQGFKQFQQQAAAQGIHYDDQGHVISSPSSGPTVAGQPPVNPQSNPVNSQTGGQPVSKPGPNGVPNVDTGDAATNTVISSTQQTAQNFQNQSSALENANVAGQGNLLNQNIQNAQNQYTAQQNNLNEFAKQTATSLAMSNAAAQTQDEAGRADAKVKYDNDLLQLKYQQAETDNTYNTQIALQQTQNQQQVIQEESRIAALGGYGNLTSQHEMMFTYQQNNLAMNQLVISKNNADMNITGQILQANKSYNAALNQVEATKQQAISDNYAKYTEYAKGIAEDKNKTETDKTELLNKAAQDYITNVAKIHGDALTARHDASVQALVEVDRLKQEQITNQRANVQMSQFTDNQGNVTSVAIDTRTGKVLSKSELGAIGNALAPTAQVDPYTGVGYIFDPSTGKVTMLGSNTNSQAYLDKDIPPGYNRTGNTLVSSKDLKDIFNIGGKGLKGNKSLNNGQCGNTYNTLTDGPKVGDSWKSKFDATTLRPTEADGTNVDIKPGMGLSLPLLVKTDGSGTGHEETVLNYNPKTGDITTIASNLDGKGTTTMETRNIKDLEKKYKKADGSANFGFIPSTFNKTYQTKIDGAALPQADLQPSSSEGTNPGAIASLDSGTQQAIKQIASGLFTMDNYPFASPGQKYLASQNITKYAPNYNPINIANKQAANASALTTETGTLAKMKSFEGSASTSLDQLIELHKSLPNDKLKALNEAGQLFGQQTNDPALAGFLSSYQDALKQANSVLNNGNSGTEADIQALEKSLDPHADQASFESAIKQLKSTMGNKIQSQSNVVNTLQQGGNLATSQPSSTPTVTSSNPYTSKIQAAKNAGYSSQDIVTHLQTDTTVGPKIKAALQAGYNYDDILQYLNK